MARRFRLVSLPGFERDVRRRLRENPGLLDALEEVRAVLTDDPHNRNRKHHTRKLTDVKQGEGQWRIRVGDYRIRYDIVDREVLLYSFRHRREVYRPG